MTLHDPIRAKHRNVVVVGGGFAGTTLVRRLQRQLPADCRVTLISEESYTTFNPMLPEAVGASIFPEHVVAPLREVLDQRRGQFLMGRVSRVDLQSRTVSCDTLAGAVDIPFDELVLAFGNRARLDFIPGMQEHSFPLKTIGDAMAIRNEVLRRLARIELESDAALRSRLGHFVVIGGGFSGVEVAGELVDCLTSIRRYYPRVAPQEIRVSVLQDIDRLLPELPEALGRSALASLKRRGVEVRLGTRAVEIMGDGVRLADQSVLAAGTVICTVGTRPNALADALGLALERGRIITDGSMAVPGHPGLWALGDCALVPNALDRSMSPPTAQFAVRQARLLAHNLVDRLADRPTRLFSYRARGAMAAIGHTKGVAQVYGWSFGGLPAWLLWRAYYLSQMPTMGRKLRIFVEWTWGMFFPADITHLRFTRSKDL